MKNFEEYYKINEGAWGHGPLDNDSVSDWKWKFGDLILKELSKENEDLNHDYYVIGMWEFFRDRLETNYSLFKDDDIEEMNQKTVLMAEKLLSSDDFLNKYDDPSKVKKYLEEYIKNN